jgi:hypothetical protein
MRARLMTAGLLAAASATLAAQTADPERATAQLRPPDLKTVLTRAAAYVEEFREKLSGIVAEETYEQQEIPGTRRETRSDLLLIRSETFPRWLQFRDTFEVDGQPVRDRAERLTNLFFEPATALERAKRIATESSRYNLGVVRTINVPLMPFVFLEREVQPRFRFARTGDHQRAAVPDTVAGHFRVATEVWVVRYEERERPTIVRDSMHYQDVPSQGRFWIEPSSGRVLMSEMRSEHPGIRAEITVNYQSEPLSGLLVPTAMYERYTDLLPPQRVSRNQWRRIEATARYGKVRRFQVEVDQHVDLPQSPIDKPTRDERPNDERPDRRNR